MSKLMKKDFNIVQRFPALIAISLIIIFTGLVFLLGAIVLFILLRKGVIRKITEKVVQKKIDEQNSYTNVFEGEDSDEAAITVNESDLFMASLEAHRGRNREDEEVNDENKEDNK